MAPFAGRLLWGYFCREATIYLYQTTGFARNLLESSYPPGALQRVLFRLSQLEETTADTGWSSSCSPCFPIERAILIATTNPLVAQLGVC